MKANFRHKRHFLIVASAMLLLAISGSQALAADTAKLDTDSMQTLDALYKTNPAAKAISSKAKAILVFPNIIKAGFIFGGSYGEGELLKDGKVSGYYNSVSASWGWQAGAQSYAYVVFLITDKAVEYLDKTDGWEFGVGPTVVVADQGVATNVSTSTLQDDAYAFITDQQGLMVSLSIEGTKITRIKNP